MGAWGTGPFDSDGALDYLGALARETALLDEEDEVIPGSVDRGEVLGLLRDTLTGAGHAPEEAYTAAGLVGAVLVGAALVGERGKGGGTRLLARLAGEDGDPLGLEAHCGYAVLLDPTSARSLQQLAAEACRVVGGDEHWLGAWSSPSALGEQLRRLERVLTVV